MSKDLSSKEDKIREGLLDYFQHNPQPDIAQKIVGAYVSLTALQIQRKTANAPAAPKAKP